MTKIQVTDGKTAKQSSAKKEAKPVAKKTVKKVAKKAAKKTPIRITVTSAATHNTLQKSTTLSRRYVKRPTASVEPKKHIIEVTAKDARSEKKQAERAAKIAHEKAEKEAKLAQIRAEKEAKLAREKAEREARLAREQAERAAKLAAKEKAKEEAQRKKAELAAAKAAEKAKAAAEKPTVKVSIKPIFKAKPTAKSIPKPAKTTSSNKTTEDKALKSAVRSVATMNDQNEMPRTFRKKNRGRRVVLALFCSALSVAALVAFVHFNMPDISVRVAAMQTGIEATYPTFVPRNYSLKNVTSDKDGEVVMYFNGPDDTTFTLSEEKSTWDSTALLNNYVKKTFPSDFSTLREQGITIYVRGENAAWVNGGILYKIHSTGKTLTKEQIRNIATSL